MNLMFENDVKMYGTETREECSVDFIPFENDVKMYGTETSSPLLSMFHVFENDVKMYGTETLKLSYVTVTGLRMM